jgi:hypothetical protein
MSFLDEYSNQDEIFSSKEPVVKANFDEQSLKWVENLFRDSQKDPEVIFEINLKFNERSNQI